MIINLNIELTEEEERLLLEISLDDGFEPVDRIDEITDELEKLCEYGLIESILGEQFYITNIGRQYLNRLGL